MLLIGALLHPRRLWLWSFHREEIGARAALLLPAPYKVDSWIRELEPSIDVLANEGVAEKLKNDFAPSGDHEARMRQELKDLGASAAEGFILYGGELWQHLLSSEHALANVITSSMTNVLLRTADLSDLRLDLEAVLQQSIPNGWEQFAAPILGTCLQHAEQYCHQHFQAAIAHSHDVHDAGAGVMDHLGAADGHLDILKGAAVDGVGHMSDVGDAGTHAMGSATEHAINAFDVHIPVFTVARASMREFSLLRTGKTDGATAAKHIAVDTGSSAVGMALGGFLGSIVPGPGTALGAAAGGILGKKLGNWYKHRTLNSLSLELTSHVEAVTAEQEKQVNINSSEYNTTLQNEQRELRESAKSAGDKIRAAEESHSRWIQDRQYVDVDDSRKLLSAALIDIDTSVAQLIRNSEQSWRSLLWPDVEDEAMAVALARLRMQKRVLSRLVSKLSIPKAVEVSIVVNVLAGFGCAEEALKSLVKEMNADRLKQRDILIAEIESRQKEVLSSRYNSIGRLNKLASALQERANNILEPLLHKLDELTGKIVREKDKLGLS